MISIIVPVYNVEKYVERCINSILAQSYGDFELIIVNDGSTDGSREICSKYAEIDPRIKLIDKTNGGVSDARNVGIENSKGEYLCFVDSDDFINEIMLYELWNNISSYDADISICSFERLKDKDGIKGDIRGRVEILTTDDCYSKIYSRECDEFTVPWAKVYKRELFNELRYPVGKIHEDEFVTYKLFGKANRIVYTSAKLYYYLQNDNSIMHTKFSIKSLVRLDAYTERIDFFISQNKTDVAGLASQRYIEKALEYYVSMVETRLNYNEKCEEVRNSCIAYYMLFRQYYKYSSLRVKLQVIFFCKNIALFWLHTKYVSTGIIVKRFLRKLIVVKFQG